MGSDCLHEPETSRKGTGLVGLEEVSFNLLCPGLPASTTISHAAISSLQNWISLIHQTEMATPAQSFY